MCVCVYVCVCVCVCVWGVGVGGAGETRIIQKPTRDAGRVQDEGDHAKYDTCRNKGHNKFGLDPRPLSACTDKA